VVISDIMMAEMNGIELLHQIKGNEFVDADLYHDGT